jgi:hypothetical protein
LIDRGAITPGSTRATATPPPQDALGAQRARGDAVDIALRAALVEAMNAGHWDIVAQLARELEARQLVRGENILRLPVDRSRVRR